MERLGQTELRLSALLAVAAAATVLGCGGASGLSSCATAATPDLFALGDFDVDTGLAPVTVGAGYGQPRCQNQYLVEVDLTAATFTGHGAFEVSGFWSSVVDMQSCSLLQSIMSVFVFDGSTWRSWDVATYSGVAGGGYCTPEPQHTDPGSVGFDVTVVPLTNGFQKARIAVNASEAGTTLAVAVAGAVE